MFNENTYDFYTKNTLVREIKENENKLKDKTLSTNIEIFILSKLIC